MSNTSLEHNLSACANCGKGEEESVNLKKCTACKLVKYCSRDCQIAHRPQHKKECKKRAAELHDEKLFKQPPQLYGDCPICMIRLPTLVMGRTYMVCCGKFICSGCMYADVYDHEGNVLADTCPFCRSQPPYSEGEVALERKRIKQYYKRMEMNDASAFCTIGCYYFEGIHGFAQNYTKALEHWQRAAELGDAESYTNIGNAYEHGLGVWIDKKKAIYYYELAAMKGHSIARNSLGNSEVEAGNRKRALWHYMIAVKDGSSMALQNIDSLCPDGSLLRGVYEDAQRHYQAYLDEIKSDQRDEAAAHYDYSKYY